LTKRWYDRVPSDKNQLRVGRVSMLIIGVLGVWVAFYIPKFGGAFQFALQFYSLTAAFMMPVFLGLLYRRTPWWSGMASCSAAIILALTLMGLGLWNDQAFARNMISESIAATIVFFGSAFWFKEDDPRHAELRLLEKDLREPAYGEKVHLGGARVGPYILIGKICVVMGIIMILCVFTPSTQIAPASLNVVAGVLSFLLGAAILYFARDKGQPNGKATV
jgi:SSS family solute:Na+ symporter